MTQCCYKTHREDPQNFPKFDALYSNIPTLPGTRLCFLYQLIEFVALIRISVDIVDNSAYIYFIDVYVNGECKY